MNIEQWSLDRIIPYARNPRDNRLAVAAVKASIKEFGFRQPIVVDKDGVIVAGHTRYLAAQQLELDSVPVHVATELSPIQIKAYRLADNRTADNATWDDDLLKLELQELQEEDFDLDLTGFNDEDLARLIEPSLDTNEVDAEPQIDKAEELREKWGVTPGQLWQLGDHHRLICGDCTDPAIVARVMEGAKVKLLVTDPPYGISIVHIDGASVGGSKAFGSTLPGKRAFGDWGKVQRGPTLKNQIIAANQYPVIEGDDKPFDPEHLLNVAEHTVLFGANYFAARLPCTSGWICWDKREQITRNSFADCELAWTSDNRPARIYSHLWNGLHKGSQHGERRRHPTEKPVALFSWIIEQYTNLGDIVSDWYLGSGTTIIACERLGRKCRAIEVSPGYVSVTLQRFFDATGIEPKLLSG